MNRIVEVNLKLTDGRWIVSVTKEFAPDHGGGFQSFTCDGGLQIHHALHTAQAMVTLTPGERTEVR